jgi:glycosyltransferase involved in cell wall biosynthesis
LRILLTSNAPYLPPRGGSTRSNLAFLEAVVERGHTVRVVAAAAETATELQRTQLRQELAEQQLEPGYSRKLEQQPISTGHLGTIEIVSVRDFMRHVDVLHRQIEEFRPDWVLVSSEDVSHTLLREAARSAAGQLIYIAHTPQFFPFGPASWHRDEAATAAARNAAAVVVISQVMAGYVRTHLGRDAVIVHPPLYNLDPVSGTCPLLGNFESGAIGMINPCAVKGISLFLAIADLMPDCGFAALPGWGTTREDFNQLRSRRKIAILPRVKQIEDFLQRLSILLMPSLWLEGFGLIAAEAMLRGVPVIASDSGGLREAKAGSRFLIPVHLIESYEPVFDDRNMPRPVLPAQDSAPWVAGIRALSTSKARYQEEQRAQQEAALRFVQGVDRFAFEKLLSSLTPDRGKSPISQGPDPHRSLESLSDNKRALLLKRLRQRQPAGRG